MGKVIEHHHTLEFIEILVLDQLRRALREKKHPFRHMAISTMGANGASGRMVVLRDLEQKPLTLWFHTDIRSGKIMDIRENPSISVLFWHPTSRLQVRLRAEAVIHYQNDVAKSWWNRLDSHIQAAYLNVMEPGSIITGNSWTPSFNSGKPTDAYFAAVSGKIKEMDVLQLSRSGHIRAAFVYDDGIRTDQHFHVP